MYFVKARAKYFLMLAHIFTGPNKPFHSSTVSPYFYLRGEIKSAPLKESFTRGAVSDCRESLQSKCMINLSAGGWENSLVEQKSGKCKEFCKWFFLDNCSFSANRKQLFCNFQCIFFCNPNLKLGYKWHLIRWRVLKHFMQHGIFEGGNEATSNFF